MILIAGLPSSGNHVVRDHIKRGVESLGTSESVQIWHGDNESPNITRPAGERLVFVVPVRSEATRLVSVQKRSDHGRLRVFPFDADLMRRNVWMLAVKHGARLYNLSYEGLVQDPDGVGRNVFEWLALPWVPWPTERAPGRPPCEGPVFDANKAHS